MRPGSTRLRLAAVTVAAGLAAAGLAPGGASGATDATTTVVHIEIGPAGTVVRTQTQERVPVLNTPGGSKPTGPVRPVAPPVKVDPMLAAAVKEPAAANATNRVIVTFREDLQVPQLPELDTTLPRTAPANAQKLAQTDAIVADVAARRRAGYQALSADLARSGVRTVGTYWLIKSMVLDVPGSVVAALAQRPDVNYVEPVDTKTPPPDAEPGNDEFFARFLMRTDPYFNLGQTSGFVGILDTGVRATHTLFNNPSKPWIREDLTDAVNPNPDDDCWNHGTSTLGILTGNSNLGNSFRGITGITVDSFKVYPAGCTNLNTDAAVRGFQRALQVGDRVIVAEIQGVGTETSALSAAADGAYDAGAVVVAANGNNGPNPGTVNVPAVAQKALGIGAVDILSGQTPSYQSLGPAPDGRTKPDLQAPTNVETASNASDTATQVFTGTSAATPHAAGAAALARNFLRGTSGSIDPGSVYAFMIATGNSVNGSSTIPPINNTSGAGLVRMPVGGHITTSAKTIGNAQTALFPITIEAADANSTNNQFNVAIWWPELPATHNDMDLVLVDPNGVTRAASLSASGVFERVHILGPLVAGNWTAQVRGFNVPGGSQLVHLAAMTTQN